MPNLLNGPSEELHICAEMAAWAVSVEWFFPWCKSCILWMCKIMLQDLCLECTSQYDK